MKTIIAENTLHGLQSAFDQAKALQQKQTGVQGGLEKLQVNADSIRIELADGIHKIDEPIKINGTDFGSGLVLAAAPDAHPVIDATVALDAEGFVQEGGYFVYRFQPDADGNMPVFHDFYDNGRKIPICRSRFSVLTEALPDPKNRDNPENLIGLYVEEGSLKGIDDFTYPVEFHIFLEWEYYMFHAVGVDYTDRIFRNGRNYVRLKFKSDEFLDFIKKHHPLLSIERRLIYYSNHPALLTPGTWAYDGEQGILYYMPEQGKVEAPAYSVTRCLIEVENAANIRFENLTFTGTGCTEPAVAGYMSGQANTEVRYGVLPCSAVLLRNTKNISFENCSFTELGSNGIQSADRAENIVIRNCIFKNNAMSAVSLGSHNTEWLEQEANYQFEITNNYMEHIGMEYPTCPGIYIAHIDGLKLMHNTIRDVAYSGISVGWRWDTVTFGYGEKVNIKDAEIAYNRIEDFMKLLRDGGAIYVVGGNCKVEHQDLFNTMHDNFAVRPQDKEWKNCSRGYYLDGASSNWHVYRNVTSGAIRPLFIQYVVEEQFCHNVLAERIYSTDRISPKNPVPERNITVKDCHVVPNLKRMFKEYPEAKEIYENSGSDIEMGNYEPENMNGMSLVEFQGYAKEETERVKKALPKLNEGDVRFAFITDLHYKFIKEMRTTVSNIIHAVNELNKTEKIDFICLGGDNVGNYPNSREEHIAMMEELAALLKNCDVPVLCLQGNHDDNSIHGRIEGTNRCRTGFEVPNPIQYDVLFSQCEHYENYHVGGRKALYGYFDIPEADTRVVLLDSSDVPRILGHLTSQGEFETEDGHSGDVLKYNQQWDFGYSAKQLDWLCHEALADAPENVIFMQHMPFDSERHPGEEGDVTRNLDAVDAIIKAFVAGDKLHIVGGDEDFEYDICADFGGKTHRVPARIAGHCHVDTVSADKAGFLSVTTMLAGRKASGMGVGDDSIRYEREPYSASETSMDIFTFSPKEDKLTATRYGGGVSREIRK